MANQNDGQDRPHLPTQTKLDDARRKGDVPRSMDVSAAAGFLGFLVALGAFGADAAAGSAAALASYLDRADGLIGVIVGPGGRATALEGTLAALTPMTPLFLTPFVFALGALIAQGAFAVAGQKLAPKLSRVNPIETAKNKFGPTGLVEFAKSVVKMSAVSIALVVWFNSERDTILTLYMHPAGAIPAELLRVLIALLSVTALIWFAIGAIDLFWQRYNHSRKLMMTHQELKEEAKRAEGDPEIKQRRRKKAEDIATNRMMQDVPDSDVVIVNPVHVAVALKWSRLPGTAPVCVAKGEGEVARRIREIAEENDVPIWRDVTTARALNELTPVGQEIDPDHYGPVAAAIRFAEKMRRLRKDR